MFFYFTGKRKIFFYIYDVILKQKIKKRSAYHYCPDPPACHLPPHNLPQPVVEPIRHHDRGQLVHFHVPGVIQARGRTFAVRHTLSAPGGRAHRQLKRAAVPCECSISTDMHAPLPGLCTNSNFYKCFRVYVRAVVGAYAWYTYA